jgi:hypothetical protein
MGTLQPAFAKWGEERE